MSEAPIIVWFRQDLRLTDNPALSAAARTKRPIIPLYILDDTCDWPQGGASRWWLHHSLRSLTESLASRGANLILRRGEAGRALHDVIQQTGATAVYWNRLYEPSHIARDTKLKSSLGVEVQSFNSALLREPWDLKTGAGSSFRVFTPFFRALSASMTAVDLLPAPAAFAAATACESDVLEAWRLTPAKPNWASGFPSIWQPGELGAQQRQATFLNSAVSQYANDRDRPDIPGTSRLSPHLHFGEIGPRQVWHAACATSDEKGAEKFKAEIGWREFSYHLLYHAPEMPSQNLRHEFDAFPWRDDEPAFKAWTQGKTGVPIVDAGMRELWATGWMHNRVRMIAASFLTKNLLIDWRRGAAWFWDTLVDADLASNSASWQWVAGCGADAAPYFRIFNPVLQGQKFDAAGAYVKKWVPELAGLNETDVHAPWALDASKRTAAGVELGRNYPNPIVDLAATRNRALAAFAGLKSAA